MIGSRADGVAEDFLTLSGFQPEMLADLVRTGLVTVVAETSGPPIKAKRYGITDDGRKAIVG
jgi:hypothetical protein